MSGISIEHLKTSCSVIYCCFPVTFSDRLQAECLSQGSTLILNSKEDFKMEWQYALQQNSVFKRQDAFPLLPQLQFSGVLVKWQRFFAFLGAQQGKDGTQVLEQRLELKQMQVEDFIFTLISAVVLYLYCKGFVP